MVLRCSLLGHDYGEPEVERERDTRGSEVVLTVEEYELCARCGTKNVISENTEVTSVADVTGADETSDAGDEPSVAEADEADGAADTDGSVGEDGAVVADDVDDPEVVAFDEDDDGSEVDSAVEVPTDENGDPITDDAEILEPSDEPDPARGHGEWPDSEDVGPPVAAEREPSSWPESDGDVPPDAENPPVQPDRSGRSDEPGTEFATDGEPGTVPGGGADGSTEPVDDAVLLDADEATGGSTDARSNAGPERDTDTGFESAGAAPSPGEPIVREGVPTEYFCPGCSFVAPGDRGSLRPGDICPECKKGYLGERER